MTSKGRIIIKICAVVLALSIAVMAVSMVIQIIHFGWEEFNAVNIIPLLGMAVAMVVMLLSGRKKDGKKR